MVIKTFSLLFGSPAYPLSSRYTNKSLFDTRDSFSRFIYVFKFYLQIYNGSTMIQILRWTTG